MRHDGIHRLRAVLLGLIRLIALTMVVVGVVLGMNRVLFGLWGTGNLAQAWSNWMGVGTWHGIFFGVPLAGAGLVLATFSGWLSRWIVQAPAVGCARCGYVSLGEDGRCSECGYR